MHEYPQCECLARSPLVGWLWRRAPRLGSGRRDLPKDSGHPELDADRGRRGWPRYAGLGLTPSSLVVGLSTDLRWENSWWNVPRRGGGGVSIPGHYAGYRPGRAQPSTRPAPPPRWQPSCGPAASFCSLPPSFRASAGRVCCIGSPECPIMSDAAVDTSSEITTKDLKEKKEVVEEAENGREAPANGNAENEENGEQEADNEVDEEEEEGGEEEEEEEEGDGEEEDGDEDEEAEAATGKRAAEDDEDDDVDTKKQKTDEDD
uniref:Prothymosin alpha n=1 Tax=Bos indicus x Bos taurus TaxID=30522 RepID=A0A4W2FZ74_BOBOX